MFYKERFDADGVVWSRSTPGGEWVRNEARTKQMQRAAPDLLAALRELVGQRDAHFHTQGAWDAARAAIAKAEGV